MNNKPAKHANFLTAASWSLQQSSKALKTQSGYALADEAFDWDETMSSHWTGVASTV
jgi:hypothetical protein